MACGFANLNKKITIQVESETTDSGGGYLKSWVNISTDAIVWAKIINFTGIKNPTGRDVTEFDTVNNHLTYKFIIRARRDILAKMRVVYDGNNYNIRTVLLNEENGAFMEIFAEKGVAT